MVRLIFSVETEFRRFCANLKKIAIDYFLYKDYWG